MSHEVENHIMNAGFLKLYFNCSMLENCADATMNILLCHCLRL